MSQTLVAEEKSFGDKHKIVTEGSEFLRWRLLLINLGALVKFLCELKLRRLMEFCLSPKKEKGKLYKPKWSRFTSFACH